MKQITLLFLAVSLLATLKLSGQNIYYDAGFLRRYVSGNYLSHSNFSTQEEASLIDSVKKFGLSPAIAARLEAIKLSKKDSIFSMLIKYHLINPSDTTNATNINTSIHKNPFFESIDASGMTKANEGALNLGVDFGNITSSIGGLDVTNIVNGIASLMIERAKEELTIAFFDRFKKFAANPDYPEFQTLFPKTTDNLNNLLTYAYPQMLPVLRAGFFDDLKQITFHLEALMELPKYQKLLSNFPEVKIAVRSLQIVHELESGSSNAADVIKEFASFPEWVDTSKSSPAFKNTGSLLKVTSIISESLRKDSTHANDSIWISSMEVEKMFSDSNFTKIYMGLVYQQIKNENINFYRQTDSISFADGIFAKQKDNIMLFQNKIAEFISVASKVNTTFASAKAKKAANEALTNDDYYNYINVSLDAIDYSFSIVKVFDKNFITNDYLSIARKSNSLYKDIYTKQYTQAISDGIDILSQVHDLVKNSQNTKVNPNLYLDSLLSFVEKVKPYAIFMANMIEAKTSEDVQAALENVILPVGSSSIKKNAECNISIQSYLGAYLSTSNGSTSNLGSWSDKFGVTAPIGISWTPGFLSWQKTGSLSLFVPVFDIGAIVDYQLKMDSTVNANGTTNANVVSKNYSIKLGQIFSPGVYAVYGFFGNLPLAIGFGGQYGPGLSKIDAGSNTVITNPSWRWNFFLAVDLPFFTLKNKMKSN